MKKAQGVLLYPGVVLRSNGMIVMPRVPQSKSSTSVQSRALLVTPRKTQSQVSSKRK